VRTMTLRGRGDELAVLEARLDAAAAGQDSTVLVEGVPGSGKTGLLREAVAMADRRGMRVGTAAAAPSDQVGHMGPMLAALFDGSSPPLVPGGLAALHDLPEQRHWLFEDLAAQLERAAMDGPLLVCLDDMQWADLATLAALRRLPVRLAGLPIVWLAASRSHSPRVAPRSTWDALTDAGALRLTLGPLTEGDVARIVTDLVGAPPDGALRQLTERAQGNSFLLVELLRGLVEESLVRVGEGSASLVEDRLPRRLSDGIRERLRRLSATARRVACTAVALGRTFTVEQLATMLDLTPSALLDPVEELLAGDLLVETGGVLAYRHDVVREAVQDTLPASALRALQRQGVDALLRGGSSPVDVAAQLAEGVVHAVAHLDRALWLHADDGAPWQAGRVRGRPAAPGARRRLASVTRPTQGWPALTESELAVVRLVVGGMTNRETAEHLFLSPHTVSSHVRHTFVKLGINSRLELAKAAAEHDAIG
jgi:DNA-binding CsgD family transcriptional regulator